MFDRAFSGVRRRGQLFLISGRSGAGKTTLVQQWLALRRKYALYWTANAHLSESDQATDFAQQLSRHLRSSPVPTGPYARETWRGAFTQLFQSSQSRTQIVVIDQVTDILIDHSAFAGALQQAWDQKLQTCKILLILIGDHYGRIYEHLRSYAHAPLYGRFTAVWQATPLTWHDFSPAFRRWSIRDRILAYGITGGWPMFVKKLDPKRPPRQALAQLIASEEYSQSVRAILNQFEPTRHKAIIKSLRALAQGAAPQPDLKRRSRLNRQALNAALADLDIAELVTTDDIPIEGRLSLSQRVVFRLSDNQVRFFFRFLEASPKASAPQDWIGLLKWQSASVGQFLAELVVDQLLLSWLMRVGPRKLPMGYSDRIGPFPGTLPCDKAVVVVDRYHQHLWVCGVFGQARPLGESRVRAFRHAVEVTPHWPGYACSSLLVSLSGFTHRARTCFPQAHHTTLDQTQLMRGILRLRHWGE